MRGAAAMRRFFLRNSAKGRCGARLWEFRSFMSYVRRYGVRPPGMDRSCR
jgi:hypothetical protein